MKRIIISSAVLILFSAFTLCAAADKEAAKKVVEDLKAAFTGETTASAKYAAYAEKAKQEGLDNIALLFEAASKAENIHAGNHKAALEQIGETAPAVDPKFEVNSTSDNLKDAIKGETYESSIMYPSFLKDAGKAGITIASISFNYANKTELKHKALYEGALKALEANDIGSLASVYQVCPTCGNTYAGEAPARCGICMTGKDRFLTVE